MNKLNTLIVGILLLVFTINFLSAIIIDTNYVTVYPGKEGKIIFNIENNENLDIKDVSVSLDLSQIPFTSVGSSTKDIDDLEKDDDDSTTFIIRASTDIVPGDYNIPYIIRYFNAENSTQEILKTGGFGIRVSARTDLDFSVETRGNAIVGREGQVSLEIINRGLGEIKSVSVEIFPKEMDLISANKVFVGTIDPDDSDTATFDVIYKSQSPTFSAKVTYKDFDNNDQFKIINLPFKVYSEEEALKLGLINKNKTLLYVAVIVILLVILYILKVIKKRKKKNRR